MRVIPKQDSFDAFQFTELDQIADLIRFVRTDDDGEASASVRIEGHDIRLTISAGGHVVTVNRNQWLVRRGDDIQVMDTQDFDAAYQRSFA